MSILLTILVLFLLTYAGIIGFALYKVFMFARNKELKGYCRRVSVAFILLNVSIILSAFMGAHRYIWNDNISYYCKLVSPESCACEKKDAKTKCLEVERQKQEQSRQETEAQQAQKTESQPQTTQDRDGSELGISMDTVWDYFKPVK